MFSDLIQAIDLKYFFFSALLFMFGLYLGPAAVEKEMTSLLKYPRAMMRLMERYFKPDYSFITVFLIIVILNNISLFSSFVSGFLIIGPPVAAFLTGFNVAVISFEMLGWRGIWHILLNPVAWLEFPAAWISFALGFELAKTQLTGLEWHSTLKAFEILWPVYAKYVFVLLLFSAVLETALILFARRFPDEEE